MGRVFYNTQYSDYLGENRAILDINVRNVPDVPSPTPSITPSPTPTPSITPTRTVTPTVTPTSTVTPTVSVSPTVTPTITPTPTSSPGPSFDPDAQAFINATGISGGDATAINTLVVDLKSAGIWSLLDAAYPFIGGTIDTCKYNLMNPVDTDEAYRMSFNGSWTINTSGVVPTSKSSANYGDSHWMPTSARNSNHHYYRYINQVGTISCDYAGISGPFLIMGACQQLEWFDGAYSISVGGVVAGTDGYSQAISRLANNDVKTFRKLDGGSWTQFSSSSTAPGDFSAISMYIGAVNGYPSIPEQMRYGFLSYGQGLTTTQIADLDSIVTTYNTTLGRNF